MLVSDKRDRRPWVDRTSGVMTSFCVVHFLEMLATCGVRVFVGFKVGWDREMTK